MHFTDDGADYLARAVFALLDARWQLTKQADPRDPIGWNIAAGSGEVVPGYSLDAPAALPQRRRPVLGHDRAASYSADARRLATPTTDGDARRPPTVASTTPPGDDTDDRRRTTADHPDRRTTPTTPTT